MSSIVPTISSSSSSSLVNRNVYPGRGRLGVAGPKNEVEGPDEGMEVGGRDGRMEVGGKDGRMEVGGRDGEMEVRGGEKEGK